VPLFPSVDAAVRELAARAVERGRYAPDELVFGSMRGKPLQPSNFRQRVWNPALQHAGLESETTTVRSVSASDVLPGLRLHSAARSFLGFGDR
jgi:hypothetical protein